MDRAEFLLKVGALRNEGKSIRAIAAELGVHRNRVHRALGQGPASKPKERFADGVFVGRQKEMVQVQAALDDVLAGKGRLVMLVGEPGIGKSRTAQEVAQRALESGFQLFWGHCPEERGAPPYWPWVQVIRAYTQQATLDDLRAQLTAGASVIADVVPEINLVLPDLAPAPHLDDPERARFQLFDSVTTFLKNVSNSRPLAIALDNLHWADQPSLLLLEFLAQEMGESRILIIGTYRDTEVSPAQPLFHTLGELTRQRLFLRIPLRGWSQDEVGRFIRLAGDLVSPRELTELIHSQTGGNPLFVGEVVRLLEQEQLLSSDRVADLRSWSFRLPDGIREAIGRRMHNLSQDCNLVLAVASVVGKEFSIQLLERLAGLSEERLLEALEEALDAGVIQELLSPPGRYQFAHVLIQQAVASQMSITRQARLHLRIAQTLEEMHGSGSDAYADELSHHFIKGNELHKACEYAVKAGDSACDIYAWERAIGYYETALMLMERLNLDASQQAEMLEKLAEATSFSRGKGAVIYLEKALSLYQTLGIARKVADIHLRLASQYALLDVGFQNWKTAYSHGLKATVLLEAEGGSLELARAYTQTGYYAAVTIDEPLSKGTALMERGLCLSAQSSDAKAATEAAIYLGIVIAKTEDSIRGFELLSKAIEDSLRIGEVVLLSQALCYQTISYLQMMDAGSGLRSVEEALQATERSAVLRWQMSAGLLLPWAAILAGDAPRALAGLSAIQQLSQRRGVEPDQWPHPALLPSGIVHFMLGNWDAAEEAFLKQLDMGERMHHTHKIAQPPIYLCRLYLEQGHPERARAYAEKAAEFCKTKGETATEIGLRALLAEASCKDGNMKEATTQLRRVQEIMSQGNIWRGITAQVRHAEGVLAAATGRRQDAEAAFQQAVEINRLYKLPYFEARTLMEWSETLPLRGRQGDRKRAIQLLDQALDIFRRIEAKKMLEKAIDLKGRFETRLSVDPEYPDGLTQREVEVLRIIALGKSNQEIADELVISPYTVVHHVTNILAKTSTANRTEAAAYAVQHGLLPPSKA